MIAEKIETYLASLHEDDRATLLKALETIELNGAAATPDADELLSIAADEINADATTFACIAAYAYIPKESLINVLESNVFSSFLCK